eukprot:10665-Eustigmatos_ZCMA.PRE.1
MTRLLLVIRQARQPAGVVWEGVVLGRGGLCHAQREERYAYEKMVTTCAVCMSMEIGCSVEYGGNAAGS